MANGTKRGTRAGGSRALGMWVLPALMAAVLAACGPTELATNPPGVPGAAATALASAVPPGAGATAAAAATTVATNVPPGAGATLAAVATNAAPTVNAAVTAALATPVPAGPEATVTGRVTAVDPVARTFTVEAAGGASYDFTVSPHTGVDFASLANNLASTQQVTVTYRGVASPYEALNVR